MMLHDLDARAPAIAAGFGVLVVVLSYDASSLGDGARRVAALVAVVAAIAVGRALPILRGSLPAPGLAPLPVAAALIAVALCVPETGPVYLAAVVLGGVVVLELATRQQADIAWYALAAGLVGWVGLYGASGRLSALVGALFAWWAVVLLWAVDRLVGLRSTLGATLVAAVGLVAVVAVARTGGVADSAAPAVAAAALAAAGSLAVAAVVAGVTRTGRQPSG
jgi:hypothetical protein